MLSPPPRAPLTARHHLLDLLLFAALACAVLRPLVGSLATAVPLGTEDVSTVPFAMAWTFWWQADRLAAGLAGFWDAPIFHPTPGTFALSETNTLGGFLMAPITLVTGSIALSHNLFLLLTLTLNGFSAARLLGAIGLSRLAALAGGVAVLMLPQSHQEIGVLPLVPLFGILWSLHALLRWTRAPNPRSGLLVGLALAATYLLCFQYALFLAIVVAVLGWLFLSRASLAPRALASLGLGLVLAGAVVAPVVHAQLTSVTDDAGFVRKAEKVQRLACAPRHYLRTPWRQALPSPGIGVAREPGWKAFYPGTGRVLLALLGLAWALSWPGTQRWGWFLGGGALLAYALSLGPNLHLGSSSLWEVMASVVPGYGKVRSVNRWAAFLQLFVMLLGACGVQSLLDHRSGRAPEGASGGMAPSRGWATRAWGLAALLGVGLLAAEIVPPPQALAEAPDASRHQRWGRFVQEQVPEGAPLAFLPFSSGGGVEDYEADAGWMMLGGVYRRPMANGYSSYFPRPFRDLKKRLLDFPTEDGVQALREVGVSWLVMEQDAYPRQLVTDYPGGQALQLRFSDDVAGVDIYELAPED